MFAFSAGSCTAFLVTHIIRCAVDSTTRTSSELLSALPSAAALLITLIPDAYGFTCMGLHFCVYMFLLLQVCSAEPHFRFDKLLKISFTLTWPAAVVWIAGFRYFQDGTVHIALAIVLLSTATGQECFWPPGKGNFGQILQQFLRISTAFTLLVMRIYRYLAHGTDAMAITGLRNEAVAAHAKHMLRGCLSGTDQQLLAAAVSTLTLGGLAYMTSQQRCMSSAVRSGSRKGDDGLRGHWKLEATCRKATDGDSFVHGSVDDVVRRPPPSSASAATLAFDAQLDGQKVAQRTSVADIDPVAMLPHIRTSVPHGGLDIAGWSPQSSGLFRPLPQQSLDASAAAGSNRMARSGTVMAQTREPNLGRESRDADPGHIQLHHLPSEAETSISPPAPVSESCQTGPELLFERIRGCGSPAADTGSAECSDIGPAGKSGVWVHPQLQGLLLTLRQSASTMAHDMRNPLTLVLAMSDLLRKKDDVTAEVRQQCSVVHTCAHHMLMMIAAMRDNLWLMTGRLDLVPTQTQVLPLINDALENFQGLVRERVKIQIEVPPDSLCCMDLDRLKHVIHVPLANAVKYTKRGTVKITSSIDGDFLLLSFCNSGVAPNPQTLEAFSLEAGVPAASDPHSRMRFGLRFVTQLLRESGGSVSMTRNGEGHSDGCTVTLRLPRSASTRPSEAMLILADGTSSLQDLTPEQASAALERSRALASGSPLDDQIHQPQTGMPNGGPTPQHNCEAFPHGPLDPELAKDIEKLLDDTAKDASGPTTAEERAEHLQRYFQQGPVQAPLRDAFKSVQDHGIIENPSDHTILIVDDDETNIRVLNTLLSREGYNTVYALSGFQALELFAQAMPKPSCVLLDIGLPDISGEEVCSKLLQMSAHMPVPIIIVSQRKETKDVIGGLRRGAVDYIRKPFEAEEVLARLSTILRFHMMDLKQRRASAKQVIEMMRLLFPPHIVDLATTGHRVAVESLSCVVVLSLHIHGFRTMSSSVPMATAVSKVSSLLNMMSKEALSRGLEQADMAHDKFVACAIAEDSSQIPEKVMAVVEAAKAIFANCDEMQAGSTLRLQICMGLHAGPAVAAVVGVQRPKWVMFGAALDIARTLRRMAVPSSILLSSEVESLLREHNPPSACIRCVPMMLNGFGWIQPYTLPLGTYKNVMHGQYNHLAPQDKAQWFHAHKGTQSAAKGLSSGWQNRDMNAADGPGMGSRSSVMMQSQISGWSGTTSTGVQQSDITLDQWLSQLGIAHYSQVLKGLTIAQVMDMDQHKLQEAGVITSSAIMRIQHAKEITRHFCK